jgi:glycosyltransferase involved in cell wall biosynthesis
MSSVRTLVVAYDFPPHAAIGTQRTLRFVRHIDAEGWPVAVLTGDPSRYRKGTPVDDALVQRVPAGVNVVRTNVMRPLDALTGLLRPASGAPPKPESGSTAARREPGLAPRASGLRSIKEWIDVLSTIPDAEVGWLLPAIMRGVRVARQSRAEVIYSSAPPWTGHLVAGAIAAITKRPWVADFRDPWARAPWRSARAHPFANRAATRLERWAVERASAIVFTTDAVREEFAQRYGTALAAKFSVVPNGCDASMFDGIPHESPANFVLLHAGSLYGGRDPRPLFRAIASAIGSGRIDRNSFRLQLLGVVALRGSDLEGAIRDAGLEDVVQLLPRADHQSSLRAMRKASALLLLQQGTTMSVPAKVYEYMAAGKRIFAICDEGETAALVRANGASVVAPPADARALEDALVAFVNAGDAAQPSADRALFDGAVGAAKIRAVVEAVARRDVEAPAPAAPGDVRSRA